MGTLEEHYSKFKICQSCNTRKHTKSISYIPVGIYLPKLWEERSVS